MNDSSRPTAHEPCWLVLWALLLAAAMLIVPACGKVSTGSGPDAAASDDEPDGSLASDAMPDMPDADPGCVTGVFDTSTFDSACFGE